MDGLTVFMISVFILLFVSACAGAAHRQVKRTRIIDQLLKELHMTCDPNWGPCDVCRKPRFRITHVHQRKLNDLLFLCKECLTGKHYTAANVDKTEQEPCYIALQSAVDTTRKLCEKELEAHQMVLDATEKNFRDPISNELFPDKRYMHQVFIDTTKALMKPSENLVQILTPTLVQDTAAALAEKWKKQHTSLVKKDEAMTPEIK